jgi:hypothetical protein
LINFPSCIYVDHNDSKYCRSSILNTILIRNINVIRIPGIQTIKFDDKNTQQIIAIRNRKRGRRGRMVIGFTTTYAISAYHHKNCECESCS